MFSVFGKLFKVINLLSLHFKFFKLVSFIRSVNLVSLLKDESINWIISWNLTHCSK